MTTEYAILVTVIQNHCLALQAASQPGRATSEYCWDKNLNVCSLTAPRLLAGFCGYTILGVKITQGNIRTHIRSRFWRARVH